MTQTSPLRLLTIRKMMLRHNPRLQTIACLTALLGLISVAPVAAAQPTSDTLTFDAPMIGVTIPLPEQTRRGGITSEDGIARYFLPGGQSLRLYLKPMKRGATPEQLIDRTLEQVGFLEPGARIMTRKKVSLGDRLAVRLTLRLPEKPGQPAREARPARPAVPARDGKPAEPAWPAVEARPAQPGKPAWMLSLAIIPVELDRVLLVRGETDVVNDETSDEWFDQILRASTFESMQDVASRRADQIELGDRWISAVTSEHIAAALVPERWYRITSRQGNDLGYQRVVQRPSRALGLDGLSVEVQTRIDQGSQRTDTDAKYFLSNNQDHELWTIETAVRARLQNNVPGQAQVFSETGLRTQVILTVASRSPSTKDEKKWPLPNQAYLPRVVGEVVGSLLPRDTDRTFAFYTYNSQQQQISLLVYQVKVSPDGSYRVLRYARPGLPPEVSSYDAQGILQQKLTPEGITLTLAEPAQLKAIWDAAGSNETDRERLKRLLQQR